MRPRCISCSPSRRKSLRGYDTKAAMHGLRLLYECIELMLHGRITFPRPEKDLLIEVRSGEWALEKVLRQVENLKRETELAVMNSPLPEQVDRKVISEIVAEAHLEFWKSDALKITSPR